MVDKSLPIPADRLTRAAKARASKAIESIHIAYYEKGGVRDLQEKVSEQLGSTAKHIFALAIWASEQSKTLNEAIAMFLGMCAWAEAQYKQEHDVSNLKDALPTWAVFKSNILRGMRDFDLDPVEYRSEGAFRVAMQKAEQKALPAPTNQHVALKTPRGPKVKRIEEALENTQLHDTIKLLVSQIIFECESLKRNAKPDAEAVLRDAMNRLQPLVDPRRVA